MVDLDYPERSLPESVRCLVAVPSIFPALSWLTETTMLVPSKHHFCCSKHRVNAITTQLTILIPEMVCYGEDKIPTEDIHSALDMFAEVMHLAIDLERFPSLIEEY